MNTMLNGQKHKYLFLNEIIHLSVYNYVIFVIKTVVICASFVIGIIASNITFPSQWEFIISAIHGGDYV